MGTGSAHLISGEEFQNGLAFQKTCLGLGVSEAIANPFHNLDRVAVSRFGQYVPASLE
ncbi:MAG: hypothetical protein IIA41_06125 [SAR324 cluster bacterium]|nr:hypothetical protein [SAR324 cluster bacterium]